MGCNEHADPRWARPGRNRVVTSEVDEWATADGQRVAVFAQEPDSAGEKPVVVLCHGLGGSHRGYAGLGHHLASHGYAVLHPQFRDAFDLAGPELGLSGVDERTWAADPVARQRMHALLFDPEHWLSRVDRVHAVLDALAARPNLNPDGVLLAGHSFGAYTAQLLLGTRLTGYGTFAHPAVAGGILLSPQGSGDRGLTPSSWQDVELPLLVVTGTRDFGARGEGVEWRREPYDRARSRVKHLAVVHDGDHQIGGIPRHETENSPTAAVICAVATAFADRVHGDRAAGEWLATAPFATILDHTHQEEAACPTS
ncbi:alpha/beta hydrolase family protein [Amycolatopsis sp. NPDC001319]|uniref:alpha/beta hydrolase family protein n=1 Tax=unclassified Amycolatopsis TaxID=2618356 RepID=UPI0036A977E1